MFKKMRKGEYNETFIEEICCRQYTNFAVDPPVNSNSEGNVCDQSFA